MTVNLGTIDRAIRAFVGAFLIAAPFVLDLALFTTAFGTVVSVAVGIVLLATAATRFCPLYRIFGIRTCKSS